MEPEIEEIATALADIDGGYAIIRCPIDGCDLGLVRAGQCDHGHTLNPCMPSEDLSGVARLGTTAFRLSAYYDALVAAGFHEGTALYLTTCAQETLLKIMLGGLT